MSKQSTQHYTVINLQLFNIFKCVGIMYMGIKIIDY